MRIITLIAAACIVAACERAQENGNNGPSIAPTPDDGAAGFVAIGQEPGWRVEAKSGDAPSMTASLDYGERKFDASNVIATASGWSGTAPDGTAVTLVYERTPCQDSMSGEPFEATATLTVGDRTYRGCARFGAN